MTTTTISINYLSGPLTGKVAPFHIGEDMLWIYEVGATFQIEGGEAFVVVSRSYQP